MSDRNRKLAEVAELAHGVLHGIAAFDDRLEEMGPGVSARGTGPGTRGGSSSPVEAQLLKPPAVVRSHLDRLVDRLHAVALDVDAAYGEIARPQRGLPAKGEASCAWCDEAVKAAAKVADKSKDGKSPVPLEHRSPTYLYAEVRRGDKVLAKVLVCEWCYRFGLRHDRRPTIEERWVHIQGGRMPKVPSMKAAPRVKVS